MAAEAAGAAATAAAGELAGAGSLTSAAAARELAAAAGEPAAGRADAGLAAVVGAGIVGLSVAWFLQQEGFAVTVIDRRGVGAGASAGNAGWICPGLTAPLPEPGVLRYALRSLARPDSPLRIAPAALPGVSRFLVSFARHCTQRRWLRGVEDYAPITALALPAYDLLREAGVTAEVREAPVIMAFEHSAEAAAVRAELNTLTRQGTVFPVTELGEHELRAQQPLLSRRARYGLRLDGQRYLQPIEYVQNLAESVRAQGARFLLGDAVTRVESRPGGGVRIEVAGRQAGFDVGVLANGAWIGQLAWEAGVRVPMAAGRGYSFTVKTARPLSAPLHLPELRVACTPDPAGMRLAGTMEFRSADAPLDERRIDAIVRSARDYLDGADWRTLSGSWVGPRPVTADGLPLIGATRRPGLFVAGGHGMWGMTLGPATGRLLAELIVTGRRPAALEPFDPCR